MLDLESEVMRGPSSITTGGNISTGLFLFSRSKFSAANIGIIAILVHFEKILLRQLFPPLKSWARIVVPQNWTIQNYFFKAVWYENVCML